MAIRTAEDKTATLETLLNEARIEANELRTRIERYRRIIASTRLVMGHELKKPATAISGYLELATEDVSNAGLTEAVTLIEKARSECELLSELNEFYLELLRLDGGTGTPSVERVNVEEVINEAIKQADDLDAKSRVRVTFVDSLPRVPVNRNALENLFTKAWERGDDEAVANYLARGLEEAAKTGDPGLLRRWRWFENRLRWAPHGFGQER